MKPKKIHLRDKRVPQCSIHYISQLPAEQLTDDPSKVNCGTCLRMMEKSLSRIKEVKVG